MLHILCSTFSTRILLCWDGRTMMEFVVSVLLLTVQTYGRMVDFDLTCLLFA